MRAGSARLRASPHARRVPRSSARSFMLVLAIFDRPIVAPAIVELRQQLLEPFRHPLIADVVEISLEHLAELVQRFSVQPPPRFAGLHIGMHGRPRSQWLSSQWLRPQWLMLE